MKRTKLFGLLMAMIMGVAFTACEEDEDTDSILITIDSTTPVPTEAVPVGTVLEFDYVVVSDNNIEEIIIREGSTVLESIPNDDKELTAKKSHKGSFSFVTTDIETLKFAIEVEDSRGNFEILDFEVDVQSNIETYTAVLLGSQESTTVGSFYSTSTDEVFNVSQAVANSAIIDFVYFFGANNKAAIAAPADADAQTIFKGINADWAKKNETLFKLVTDITSAEFTAISDSDAAIVAATADTELFLNRVALLAEGNIVAFVTDAGKKGLFKVSTIEGTTYGAESKITIEVKVQK